MSEAAAVHKRLGTLAEKLEFSNALRKQAIRELSQERIEHGKTKALVDELQDRIDRKMRDEIEVLKEQIKQLQARTAEERRSIHAEKAFQDQRAQNKSLQERLKAQKNTINKLLSRCSCDAKSVVMFDQEEGS